MILTREQLEAVYMDWRNNYISVATFADHYGLYPEEARVLIDLCRVVAGRAHPDA